jgi:hypothetical protein
VLYSVAGQLLYARGQRQQAVACWSHHRRVRTKTRRPSASCQPIRPSSGSRGCARG